MNDSALVFEPSLLGMMDKHGEGDSTERATLFREEQAYLSTRRIQQRYQLWMRVSPRITPLLQEDEKLLYVTPAREGLTLDRYFALGIWTTRFFQVVLVFTNRRLIELLMAPAGEKIESRVRSFPWGSVEEISERRLGGLRLRPSHGKVASWTLMHGYDRTIVRELVPRIQEQLVRRASGRELLPLVLCPACQSVVLQRSWSCPNCAQIFRSPFREQICSTSGTPFLRCSTSSAS